MKLISAALLECQKTIANAPKDETNPHFRNKYATLESVLESVKPIANKNKLVIVQSCGKDSEGHFLKTTLIHESGELIDSQVYLVLDKQNMQGLGSAITYARRYSLAGLFAIGQADDDGNAASQPTFQNHTNFMIENRPIPNAPYSPDVGGNHVIGFGKKYLGKKVCELDQADCWSYIKFLKDSAAKKRIQVDDQVLDLERAATAYFGAPEEDVPF